MCATVTSCGVSTAASPSAAVKLSSLVSLLRVMVEEVLAVVGVPRPAAPDWGGLLAPLSPSSVGLSVSDTLWHMACRFSDTLLHMACCVRDTLQHMACRVSDTLQRTVLCYCHYLICKLTTDQKTGVNSYLSDVERNIGKVILCMQSIVTKYFNIYAVY